MSTTQMNLLILHKLQSTELIFFLANYCVGPGYAQHFANQSPLEL
jgi:hypothetical protein